jgi:hypothetical protein
MNSEREFQSMRALTGQELAALGGQGDVEVFEVVMTERAFRANADQIEAYLQRPDMRSAVRFQGDQVIVLFNRYETAFEFKMFCG